MQNPNTDQNNLKPVQAAEDVFVFPATLAQRRFWLLDQLVPGNAALNEPLASRLTGTLDRQRLELAVNELIRRHEILRTSFRTFENEAVQVIHPAKSIQLDWFDITHLSEVEKEREVRRLMLVEAERPFTLSEGPLLRGGLIKIREDEHVLLLTMHQIGCDGWSDGVLIRELAQVYSSLSGGEPLPELPLQYVDFAQWQKEWLESPAALEQRQFWKAALKGVLPSMNLPTDRPRRSGRSYTSDVQSLMLPTNLAESLKELCAKEDVTPYMLFLTCYGVLLSRYTEATELVIGTPASNRNQTELEGLIGRFANPLVLRLDLSGKPSLRSMLRRVKELCIGAFSHQSFPFELLIEEIQTDPLRSGLQFLQAYFVCQKDFVVPQKMAGLTLTPMDSINPGAMFELTLAVIERAEGIRVQLEFNTDLYDASTAKGMLTHFQNLLEGAAQQLDSGIDQMRLVTLEEYQRQVVSWNAKTLELPRDRRIHEEFEQQARRTPDAPALRDGSTVLTYAQLNSRANQVAHTLREMAVGPGTRVGLIAKPASAEFVVGFLGAIKAGGCCLVLGPGGNSSPLVSKIEESRVSVLLASSRAVPSSLPKGLKALFFDRDEKSLRATEQSNPPNVVLADQPAVLRFEGATLSECVFSHRALSNSVHGALATLRFQSADCVALAEGEDWLAALLVGACLVVPPDLGEFRSKRLEDWVESQRLTVITLEGPAWHELVASISGRAPGSVATSLRLLVLEGDSVSPAALAAWERSTSGRVRLVRAHRASGVLGPISFSEGSVGSGLSVGLMIKEPAPNTRIYVLDHALQSVPVGVPGDLYVGGDSLAAPESQLPSVRLPVLVSERAPGKQGERLIRTGQRGRFLQSRSIELIGSIEELSRTSNFSLELSQLRSVLYQHPAVWQVFLLPRELPGKSGGHTLIAYVVSKTTPMPAGADLRGWLEGQVPSYMLPEVVVTLSEFPLTSHGGIDLERLPVSTNLPLRSNALYAAPRTNLEKTIVEIWESVLGVEKVGVHDDFFALGGHSLAAMRLFARLFRITGKNVPLVTLFQCRTVEKLAQALESGGYELLWKNLVSIKPTGTRPPFYCVHGVGGNILEFEHMARYMDADQPLYGIQAQGLDGKLPRHESVEEMAVHYIKQIREFQPQGPYYFGGSSFGGLVAYEMARQLETQGQKVGILVMFDTWSPGHPKYLPTTSAFKRRVNLWRLRIELHFSNFWLSEGSARREYLKKKAATLYSRWRRRSVRWVESLRSRFHPEAIRAVRKAGHEALDRYNPQRYNGTLTLLRATEQPRGIEDDHTNGWGTLVRSVETTEVPGHHGSMMEDPRAKVLVEKLAFLLRAAQTREAALAAAQNGGFDDLSVHQPPSTSNSVERAAS